MNKHLILLVALSALLAACVPAETPEEPVTPVVPQEDTIPAEEPVPSPSTRQEQYRPQIHYTTWCNWSNDPNGLVYKDGVWHMYYQYNPNGIDCNFGGMSWGHAVSYNLMQWEEHNTVLYPDERGAIFSGCSVVDHNNVAGFGNGAILAYYTAAGAKQLICLAVSTDGGESYFKYDRNPIVPSYELNNFRDPKITWDPHRSRWTMTIARGWDLGIEIWHSYNLMNWDFDGIFRVNIERCNMSQWECCDLLYFDEVDRWVMVVSVNPNGYITGSSTMYFVGQFDGVTFTPDADDYPLWLDYGADCYAGVTWANAPGGRKVMLAWMNNWDYAPQCPPTQWKSAYTIPRELYLRKKGDHYVLCSEPVRELNNLSMGWQFFTQTPFSIAGDYLDAWEMKASFSTKTDAKITLSNDAGEQYVITYDAGQRRLYCNRSGQTGEYLFSALFAIPSMSGPIEGNSDRMDMDIIVDKSSVELFANDGSCCFTNTVYPKTIYRTITIEGDFYDGKVQPLETIWKP